jgi:hypothetical protein
MSTPRTPSGYRSLVRNWRGRTAQPYVRTIAGEPVAKPEQQSIVRNQRRLTVPSRTLAERIGGGDVTVSKRQQVRTAKVMRQIQDDATPLRRAFG